MEQKMNVWEDSEIIAHTRLLADCHTFWTGKKIFPDLDDIQLARWMYHAPFVVVSHGNEADPVFTYANIQAQSLWNLSWKEFTSLPSRKSAEPVEEITRQALMEEGRKKGVVFLNSGIRISKEGKRFYIKDVVLFNLFTNATPFLGQGAIYERWEFI
jgi:hypothetical protein